MLRRLWLGLILAMLTVSSANAGEIRRPALDLLSPVEASWSGSASAEDPVEAPIALFDGFFEQDPGDGSGGGCASSCSAECRATGSKCNISCPLGTCAKCSSTCPVSCNCGG